MFTKSLINYEMLLFVIAGCCLMTIVITLFLV